MGYTQHTFDKVMEIFRDNSIKQVLDLGAQNDYRKGNLPAPYMSEVYKEMGVHYISIDANGENKSLDWDLGKELIFLSPFDIVVDAGTSEHVGKNGKFDWLAIYNCWLNKHNALRVGGYMYSENPKTGNWPGHGFQYYTSDFYVKLAGMTDYEIQQLGQHPACNNTKDGWNIFCMMKKKSEVFPTFEQFKTLPLKQS